MIDRAARVEITRIQLNSTGRMRNVALSRDGTRVYAANVDAHVIHVVNTSSLSEVDTDGVSGNAITPHPTSFSPSGLAVSLDDSTLFVSHERGQTVDISVFNTTTFVEGVPIVSNADAGSGTPVLLIDPCSGRLFAGRSRVININGTADGLSIFTLIGSAISEKIVNTSRATNANVFRDIDIVWGFDRVVVSASTRDGGGVGIVLVNTATNTSTDFVIGDAVTTSDARSVATIPPIRN